MEYEFNKILKNKLDSGTNAPKDTLWSNIETELNDAEFRQIICQKTDAMPESIPGNSVWENIEKSLGGNARPFWQKPFFTWAAAASFLLVSIWIGNLITTQSPEMYLSLETRKSIPVKKELFPEPESQPKIIIPKNYADVNPKVSVPVQKQDIILPETIPYALNELVTTSLPDSLIYPVIIPNHIPEISVAETLTYEETNTEIQGLEIPVENESPGMETLINYILKKVFHARRANIALTRTVKEEKKVWRINFDSRLVSVSGSIPYGKTTED